MPFENTRALSISSIAKSVAPSGGSSITLPTMADGQKPRACVITVVGTEVMYVRPGGAGLTVTAATGLPIINNFPGTVISTAGCEYLYYFVTGAGSTLHIQPLESP